MWRSHAGTVVCQLAKPQPFFGVKSRDNWELLGTKVTVKYRSAIPFWTGFHTPHRKYFDYDENWNNPSASKYSGRHFN